MKQADEITHEDVFVYVAKMIAAHKRCVVTVPHSFKEAGFCYTIGNQEKRLPELLMLGTFPSDIQNEVLHSLSDFMLQENRRFNDGELFDFGGKCQVKVVDATDPIAKREYTFQAGQFYENEDYDVQQVLVPDTNGRWPDNPRCHAAFKQPILKLAKLVTP